MKRRLLGTYLLLTLVVLIALELPLAIGYRDRQISQLQSGLERDAFVISSFVERTVIGTSNTNLDAVALNYQNDTGGRLVIVGATGDVLADSEPAADGERNFANRPEIAEALGSGVATGSRYSNTLGTGLVYVAVPITDGDQVVGAVRISYSTDQIDSKVHRYWLLLIGAGAVTLAVAGALGILLARWVTRPLAGLQRAATSIGDGDLSTRADIDDGPPEVRELAVAFNTTAIRLEQLVTAQEQFVADASHQLRTPLTALRLRLEMLELDTDDDNRVDLDGARDEVQRLSRLVDGLLALARAERSVDVRPTPLEIDPGLEERAASWQPLANERGTRIDVEPSGLTARFTPDHLGQMLDNLIANALEVSPEGSVITIGAVNEDSDSGPVVAIHVVDQGPGMSPEQRERAFDRFWRATTTRSELGGSGLGLAIVAKLIAADGGRAELRPAPDGGIDAVLLLTN